MYNNVRIDKEGKYNMKKISKIVLLAVSIVGFFNVKNYILFGDDKIAYEILADFIYYFKDPSSVKLVSGSLTKREETKRQWLYCGISATNKFGGRYTSYYVFMTYEDGTVEVKEDPKGNRDDRYTAKDALNINLINRQLSKVFGI